MKKIILIVVAPILTQGETKEAAQPLVVYRTIEGENLFVPLVGDRIVLHRKITGVYPVKVRIPDLSGESIKLCVAAQRSILSALLDTDEDWSAQDVPIDNDALMLARA